MVKRENGQKKAVKFKSGDKWSTLKVVEMKSGDK